MVLRLNLKQYPNYCCRKIQTRILARQTNTTTYYIISSRSPFYCSMCKTFCGGLKTLQCKYFAMFFKARYLSLDSAKHISRRREIKNVFSPSVTFIHGEMEIGLSGEWNCIVSHSTSSLIYSKCIIRVQHSQTFESQMKADVKIC